MGRASGARLLPNWLRFAHLRLQPPTDYRQPIHGYQLPPYWLRFSETLSVSHSSQLLIHTALVLYFGPPEIGFVWRSRAFRSMGVPPMSTTAASGHDPEIGFVWQN